VGQCRRNYGDRGYIVPPSSGLVPLYPQVKDAAFKQTTLTTRLYKVRTNLYRPLTKTFRRAWRRISYCQRHWRRQGGQRPPNGRAKKFFVKIEGLSSLPPAKSGRACYDNSTGRGYFYQMPNVYTCIACLIEIRKLLKPGS